MVRQGGVGGGLDVHAGAGGDVVEDEGLRRGVRDGGEHGDEAVLGGLVVIGRDHQQAVCADLTGVAGQVHGVRRVVGAGAGDDGHPARRPLHGEANGLPVLFVCERGALAGGPGDDQCVDPLSDLPVDKAAEGVVIDAAFGQGGDEGCCHAAENGFSCHDGSLLFII